VAADHSAGVGQLVGVVGMEMRFQPKGSMCAVCAHRNRDCSELPFFEMLPIIEQHKEGEVHILIVKCREFARLQ